MFEVGVTELLLIFAIALIVLGPQRLPKLAQQVGRWVGRARAMARQFRDQLEEEAHNLETKVNIDPGIDVNLDPKPAPPAASPPPPAQATPAPPPEPVETPEEFYPPDHHMHPSQTATEPGSTPADSTQGELDLTTPAAAPEAAPDSRNAP